MRSVIFMSAAVFAAGLLGGSPQDARLVENGRCGYTIVTPDAMSEVDAYVAKDMNELLARALGGELKTATASSAPASRRLFFGIAAHVVCGVGGRDDADRALTRESPAPPSIFQTGN